MENKFYNEETMYICRGCGDVFAFEEHAKEHTSLCIRNPLAFHGSSTDKNTKILIKAPTEDDNGYKNYQLIKWLGHKNVLVEKTIDGYRELSEKEILEEDKDYYEPLEIGEELETMRSDKWQEQVDMLYRGIEEQREINESIADFWDDVKEEIQEMEESGINGKDLSKELKEKYNIKS